jgi:hypothetical protein
VTTQRGIRATPRNPQPLGEALSSSFTHLPTAARIDDSIQEHAAATDIGLASQPPEVRRQFTSLLVELLLLAWLQRPSRLTDDGPAFRDGFSRHLSQLLVAFATTITPTPEPPKLKKFMFLIITEVCAFLPAGGALSRHERIACAEATFARACPTE